jgi:hypothetical protein
VTATKIAEGAIGATKFANGIEPVTIVDALPLTFVGNTIFLTTDKKVYRWSGSAYVRTVDGSDIIANSITAGAIAAGAIGAQQIAAGAITTSKLLVTGNGATLNADPYFRDATAWVVAGGTGPLTFPALASAPAGGNALQHPLGVTTFPMSADLIPIEPGKSYRLECWAIGSGAGNASSTCYLGIAWFDHAGTFLQASGAQPGGAGSPAGWSNGTYSYWGLINQAPPGSWTRYVAAFGSGETRAIPTNAKFVKLVALLNANASANTLHSLAGFKLMERAGADLIVDGSIIASKIAANAIAVGSAAIQDGAIVNAMIANAAIDDAKVANLSAAKITFGTMSGERIAVNTLNGNRITANSITVSQLQAGTLSASWIFAGSLSAATGTFSGSLSATSGSLGDVTVADKIRIGKTAYGSGAGFLVENNGGTPRMDLGNATQSLKWDGANLYMLRNGLVAAPLLFHRVGAGVAAGSTATAALIFRSNGEIARQINSGGQVVVAHWYYPATAGIGATLGARLRLFLDAGGVSDGSVTQNDGWMQLNSDLTVLASRSGAPGSLEATGRVLVSAGWGDNASDYIFASGFHLRAATIPV